MLFNNCLWKSRKSLGSMPGQATSRAGGNNDCSFQRQFWWKVTFIFKGTVRSKRGELANTQHLPSACMPLINCTASLGGYLETPPGEVNGHGPRKLLLGGSRPCWVQKCSLRAILPPHPDTKLIWPYCLQLTTPQIFISCHPLAGAVPTPCFSQTS